ncbi:diguanylate cyclase [Undibacterium terreum]|uniref:diguanylate cyclase n=1 Tax=Undibacterium terreum TaxID=1224302 RepID=A0A916UB18_9BURK|nr:diguanylate cyclase [Undibacterium terreum]GGC65649.1 diguanylate cyclase response regulator [Undibacterium terreum]
MTQAIDDECLILIIDDSVAAIRMLSGMLKDLGQIIFATSGEAGIQLARERKPHLILLDVEMPSMDGYEVCRLLKIDAETSGASVIFVTGSSSMESEVRALEAGAVDFITKPLNPPVVRARVRTHLKLQLHALATIQLANRDGLTGLYNRRYLDEILEKEFQRHLRQGLPLGLALIDIDHFKAYNDGYGHQEGDSCLRKVATALNTLTKRPGEIVARYGGEEFVVVLPYTSIQDAGKYGDWICEQIFYLNIEHNYSECAKIVTISVGINSVIPNNRNSVQQLVKGADEGLYLAKSAGRNRSVVYEKPGI